MSQGPSRFQQLVSEAKKSVRECTPQDVQARRDRGEALHLVDVREDSEWDKGHAAGAIHLGKGVIERDIEKQIPDLDAELVLYCGGGSRSALAADALQRMGYRNVLSMIGGFKDWKAAGLAVE
jgi:rhodanese-related sulfurtransferase